MTIDRNYINEDIHTAIVSLLVAIEHEAQFDINEVINIIDFFKDMNRDKTDLVKVYENLILILEDYGIE